MILDEFGKPIRQPRTMIAPEWMWKEFDRVFGSRAAEQRVQDLRRSILKYEEEFMRTGSTVRVRLPRRFKRNARTK